MFSFDLAFFAVAVPAILFAGISKGGFGSGAAFAGLALLALILEPATALGITLPLLMMMDAFALRPYWRRWDWRAARPLIVGAIPGVALGAWLYRIADPDIFRVLIGVIALGFVLFQGAVRLGIVRFRARRVPTPVGLVAGSAAGFTSFIAHAGGPPVAICLLAQGMGKTTYQSTTVLIFWAINLFKAFPYAMLGIFTAQTLLADLMLAPIALLGVWLGVRAHGLVPERLFFAFTYVTLALLGAKLIWDGLS